MFEKMIQQVQQAQTISYTGKIENIVGMSIEASGGRAAVGDICRIYNGESGGQIMAEVVGFKNDRILLMPYASMSGISAGNFVRNTGRRLSLAMGPFLKGRVINALGQPIDGKGPFTGGTQFCVEKEQTPCAANASKTALSVRRTAGQICSAAVKAAIPILQRPRCNISVHWPAAGPAS